MNKINNNIHQCSQCKNNFSEQEVYRIGIKKKDFFCRDCAKNIKSECMWCGKELEQKRWKPVGSENRSGELEETINHDNLKGDRHHKYYLACPETREHGVRPNQSCPSRINDWWVEKGNQKRQEKSNRGWKECQGKALYYKDPKTGKEIVNMKCWNLVPPGEKYCKDECCVLFTAVYNGVNSAERKRIRQKWDQRDQEKYRKANDWWNSLSLSEKQAELKKEEEHLNNLGLQRQRCWIERIDKNSILFENGKLHYDNMNKIPPSFLDRFGLPGFQWESVWKNNDKLSDSLQAQTEIKKEISNKEISLQQAKESGENEMIAKLERQIQELKNQQRNNSTSETPTKNNKVMVYSIVGFWLLTLIGLVIVLVKPKRKNPKIK